MRHEIQVWKFVSLVWVLSCGIHGDSVRVGAVSMLARVTGVP